MLALSSLGCALFEPPTDHPYDPPPTYRDWWMQTERCAGVRRGTFDRLRFFVLPEDDRHAGRRFGWSIWVRGPYLMSRRVVEHEMLHVLLDDNSHRAAAWTACGLYPLTVQEALGG